MQVSGNCKDCLFWDRSSRFEGVCDYPGWRNKDDEISESDMALEICAYDDSGLEFHLITGALFGCVQFKQRKGVGR
jgi:hypothetical protein